MGLDMYLYLRKSDYHSEFRGNMPNELPSDLEGFQISSVCEKVDYNVGYWRKFNALHTYIVRHIADDNDTCQEIELYEEDVEEIINICKQIEKDHSKAKELLPCGEGFFFGSQEYDEWYYDAIEYTRALFQLVLKAMKEGHYYCIYQASW